MVLFLALSQNTVGNEMTGDRVESYPGGSKKLPQGWGGGGERRRVRGIQLFPTRLPSILALPRGLAPFSPAYRLCRLQRKRFLLALSKSRKWTTVKMIMDTIFAPRGNMFLNNLFSLSSIVTYSFISSRHDNTKVGRNCHLP